MQCKECGSKEGLWTYDIGGQFGSGTVMLCDECVEKDEITDRYNIF